MKLGRHLSSTQRLECSSFFVMASFLLRDYEILPKKGLHWILWVELQAVIIQSTRMHPSTHLDDTEASKYPYKVQYIKVYPYKLHHVGVHGPSWTGLR